MQRLKKILAIIAPLAIGSGCAPTAIVPISPTLVSEPAPAGLELLFRSSLADPIRLRGSQVAYSRLHQALTQEIAGAAQPWVERHRERGQNSDGWQLLLRLTEAEATYHQGQATVTLALQATLRTRVGNQHLAQTQTHCQQSAVVTDTAASPVFAACLRDLRTELSRWLNGINP